MTADDAITQALAAVDRWLPPYDGPRSVLYRRLGLRQRQLFQMVAQINEDYYGACANTALSNGTADLRDITDPVPEPAAIQRITILDPGASGHAVGTPITIVPLADAASAIPPRMTLRDGILAGVGSETLTVVSITISYARMPAIFTASSGSVSLEIASPHNDLLVLDLAQMLVSLSKVDQAAKAAAIASLSVEENSLLNDYLSSVSHYSPMTPRFARPPSGAATLASKRA